MSKFIRGMCGRKHSLNTRNKMKSAWEKRRLIPISDEFRDKISKIVKGRKHSEISRLRMSKTMKNHYDIVGRKTPEILIIRCSIENRLWREAVFSRDNWTCQKTGIKGGKLHSHHIKNFAQYPELRFAIDNGITLSKEAHNEFHKIYGKKNNNREQLNEFLNK